MKGLKGKDKQVVQAIFDAGGKAEEKENGWELVFFEVEKKEEEEQCGYHDWETISSNGVDYDSFSVGNNEDVDWIGECFDWDDDGPDDWDEERVVGGGGFDWGEPEIKNEDEGDYYGNSAPTRETVYRVYVFVFFKSKNKV